MGAQADAAADRNTATDMVPWQFRRRWTVRVLIFCAVCILYAIYQGPEMAGVVLPPMVTLGGGVLTAYGVVATYQDTRGSR